jgi:hypothetical protein
MNEARKALNTPFSPHFVGNVTRILGFDALRASLQPRDYLPRNAFSGAFGSAVCDL